MYLMVVSLLLTSTIAIQAKDTEEFLKQKMVRNISLKKENADALVSNSEFEDDVNSIFTAKESSEESLLNNSLEEGDIFDFTMPHFAQTEENGFMVEKAMSLNDYNEFSSIKNVQIATGENFTIILKENGTVWTFGNNAYGQLGDGTTENSGIPQKIRELTNIVYINAGATFAFAINENGEVFSWGNNRYAQLGDGTCTQRNKPVRISKLIDIKKVSSGYYHAVALKNDGSIYVWGSPVMSDSIYSSQLELSPVKLDIPKVKDISSGKGHIIALSEEGEIYTWGENESGQLGNGVFGNSIFSPHKVELSADIIKIESGMKHSIAIDNLGRVYVWGSNFYGQLGDGTNEDKCIPELLESIDDIKDVIAGYNHTIFIKNNDGIYTCGNNDCGQLGIGTTENSNLPIKISNQYESILISGG